MTVTVYLDTQDLSRMFKCQNEVDENTLKELLDLRDSGQAKYIFSIWHVVEFIQKPAPGYEMEHRKKAKFLQDLCGENALPYPLDIADGTENHEERSVWIPRASLRKLTFDLQRSYSTAVDNRAGLNRKQRRTLKSTNVTQKVMRSATDLENHINDLPLTAKFRSERSLTKYVRGEIDGKEFGVRLAEVFCSPPVFYDEWYSNPKADNLLAQIVDEMGTNLVRSMQNVEGMLPRLIELRKNAKAARQEYFNTKRRLSEQGLPVNLDETFIRNLPKIDIDSVLGDAFTGDRFEYLKHYFWKIANGSKYKANDAVDLLHLFYVPNVDLMRCDIGMHQIMRDCRYFDSNKLVERLTKLPGRIRDLSNPER